MALLFVIILAAGHPGRVDFYIPTSEMKKVKIAMPRRLSYTYIS